MNPYTALHSGAFRNLITILVPGFLASLPFFSIGYYHTPIELRSVDLATISTPIAIVLIVAALSFVLALGMVSDEVGRRLEVAWDRWFRRDRGDVQFLESEWKRYLRTPAKSDNDSTEIVAHGYLADLVLLLRFEANLASALFICFVGMVFQCGDSDVLYSPRRWVFLIVALAFLLSCNEMRNTMKLLASTPFFDNLELN